MLKVSGELTGRKFNHFYQQCIPFDIDQLIAQVVKIGCKNVFNLISSVQVHK